MKIKILKKVFDKLKAALKWDGAEKSVLGFARRSTSDTGTNLIVHELMMPEESDYVGRSAGHCELGIPFLNKAYNCEIENQYDPVKFHSHPPGYPGIMSGIDTRCDAEFFRHIDSKIEGMQQASVVFNTTFVECDGWHYEPKSDALLPIEKISIIGDTLETLIPYRSPLYGKQLDPTLSRTALAFGEGRTKNIGCLDIGIVGAGGLGSPLIELIARDKPKSVLICDPDNIEASNLNRIVGATEKDIGRKKAEFYAEYIKSISSNTEVKAFSQSFYDPIVQQTFVQADVIFGAVDSGARHSINQLCMSHLIPYFDLGASIASENGEPSFIGGQVYSVIPGKDVCLSCSGVFENLLHEYLSPNARAANAAQGYIKGENIISPLVAHLDFTIASSGYFEMLKYVTGLPGKTSFKVYVDLLNDMISRAGCKTDNCIVCKEHGYIGQGDRVPFLRPMEDFQTNEIKLIQEVG